MARKTQHVVPGKNGGWSVKKGGASKASKTFKTKAEAVKQGIQTAKNQKAELVIHKKDGIIQNPNSYGKVPCPPKDKK